MLMLSDANINVGWSIILAIIVLFIVIRFRKGENPSKSSLDVLKERYERGEVTEEEYNEAKKKQGK